MNSVNIIGNVVKDPELVTTQSGKSVCNFTLANNEHGKGGADHANYIDVVAWAETGENIAKYVRKGDPIALTGKLRQDRWKSAEGHTRSKIKIVVIRAKFMGTLAHNKSQVRGDDTANIPPEYDSDAEDANSMPF